MHPQKKAQDRTWVKSFSLAVETAEPEDLQCNLQLPLIFDLFSPEAAGSSTLKEEIS